MTSNNDNNNKKSRPNNDVGFVFIGMCIFIGLLFVGASTSTAIGQFVKVSSEDETVIIGSVHQHTHEGTAYHFGNNFTMNTGDVVRFMGCTQNKTIHFREFLLTSDASPIFLEFFENTTFSSNGTSLNPGHNRNRQLKSSMTSSLMLFANPTVIDDGVRMFPRAIFGQQQKVGGDLAVPIEWDLALNTCYSFKIHNLNGNNVDLVANFFWYETEGLETG